MSISGPSFEVRLGWGKSKVELGDLFDRLSDIGEREGRKVVIVFVEAQELRKLKGFNILYPLAYAYDNLRLNFVFTGSQIGMVYRFLRLRTLAHHCLVGQCSRFALTHSLGNKPLNS